MKFSIKDIDHKLLAKRAKVEAEQIFSKISTRKLRSFDEVFSTVLYGHVAEQYLIEKELFKDDTRPYKDVINKNGVCVEVKVTKGDYYVPYVLERANKAHKETFRDYPDLLYVFTAKSFKDEYSLCGIYEWDDRQFVLQTQ